MNYLAELVGEMQKHFKIVNAHYTHDGIEAELIDNYDGQVYKMTLIPQEAKVEVANGL